MILTQMHKKILSCVLKGKECRGKATDTVFIGVKKRGLRFIPTGIFVFNVHNNEQMM